MGKILHYSHFKKERYHKNSEASILTFVRLKPKKKKKKKKKKKQQQQQHRKTSFKF